MPLDNASASALVRHHPSPAFSRDVKFVDIKRALSQTTTYVRYCQTDHYDCRFTRRKWNRGRKYESVRKMERTKTTIDDPIFTSANFNLMLFTYFNLLLRKLKEFENVNKCLSLSSKFILELFVHLVKNFRFIFTEPFPSISILIFCLHYFQVYLFDSCS